MNKELKLKIIYGAVIAFIVVYAVAVLIYLGVAYGASEVFSNLFGVGAICAAFCCVTVFTYFLAKNYKKRKRSKPQAKVEGEEVPSKKTGIGVLAIAGICLGISALLIAWAVTGLGFSAGLAAVLGDGYVKTQATVVQSVHSGEGMQKLVYEYATANGEIYQSIGEASFGGIVFKADKCVTLYYSVENPRITANISTAIMLLLGAALFLFGGVALALSNGTQKRNNLSGFIVFTFFILFGIGFYVAGGLASGLNVLELSLSGAGYYGITVFMLLGVLLDVLGIIGLVQKLKERRAEITRGE